MSALLSLEGVSVGLGGTAVLDGITLDVAEGEVLALLGPSGAGKSTLLRVLLGLVVPDRGVVTIRGEVASAAGRLRIPPEERHLAIVFQDLALWPHLTVAGNRRFVLRARKLPRDEERDRIEHVLGSVGMAGFADRYPGELSGGEQQRVALARALVADPAAVLLDEPMANLDVHLRRDLLALLRRLFREQRTTAVYVSHEPREVAQLATRIAVLEGGGLTFLGSAAELAASEGGPFLDAIRDLVHLDEGLPGHPR